MSTEVLLRAKNLRRHFKMGQEVVRALDGVDLEVSQGDFLGVTGPSGSGKSTLLYLLGGLDHPTSGDIWVQGVEIATLDEDGLADFRQQTVGFIFQMFNLIPTMTALENVEFPLLFSKANSRQRHQRASQLLDLVGLGDRLNHRPTELSGGQQQRVAIARALVNDPPLVLADEPTGNLDSHAGGEVIKVLEQLNREGRTIIVVSHDPDVIAGARRSIRLHDGEVVN
ncbi:MAG: ABC transporter ATP-binding protein [Anaerolineales bacterium]|jgi:putative ABC transport system ATP-binding protein